MKLYALLKSRKFWGTVAGVLSAIAGALAGQITWAAAINAIVAVVAAYILGTAVEDAGRSNTVTEVLKRLSNGSST